MSTISPKLQDALDKKDKKDKKVQKKAMSRIKRQAKKMDQVVAENLVKITGYHAGVVEIGKRMTVKKNKTNNGVYITIEILTDEGVNIKKAEKAARDRKIEEANRSPFPQRDTIIGKEERVPATV